MRENSAEQKKKICKTISILQKPGRAETLHFPSPDSVMSTFAPILLHFDRHGSPALLGPLSSSPSLRASALSIPFSQIRFLIFDHQTSHPNPEPQSSHPSLGLFPRGRPVLASSSFEQEGAEPLDSCNLAKWVWLERVDGDAASRSGAGEVHRLQRGLHSPQTSFLD